MSESLFVVVINIVDVLGGNWDPKDKKISIIQCTRCITGGSVVWCGVVSCQSSVCMAHRQSFQKGPLLKLIKS